MFIELVLLLAAGGREMTFAIFGDIYYDPWKESGLTSEITSRFCASLIHW